MLLDLPPFFINPLDDQVLKAGWLVCYRDKARLDVQEIFFIKDGWLHPEAAKVLPAGYYSLMDQNDLRLMDFENYCQTDQRAIVSKLKRAKDIIGETKADLLAPKMINVSYRVLFKGEISIPTYPSIKFTEDRQTVYNNNNDNGWDFLCTVDGSNGASGRININLAIELIKFAKPTVTQIDYAVAMIEGYGSDILQIGVGPNTQITINIANKKIEVTNLWYVFGNGSPLQTTPPVTLTLDNPFANTLRMLDFAERSKGLFSANRHNNTNYGLQSEALHRQKGLPIPAAFRHSHKFYSASDGRLYWGGVDYTMEQS
ncbi:MAG: hypothetical protein FWF63_00785 [Fibromonadales bacterium]|nr:hypothetical protein [Fibromonadales bacterium]